MRKGTQDLNNGTVKQLDKSETHENEKSWLTAELCLWPGILMWMATWYRSSTSCYCTDWLQITFAVDDGSAPIPDMLDWFFDKERKQLLYLYFYEWSEVATYIVNRAKLASN